MGIDVYGGGEEIHYKEAGWLVMSWCHDFEKSVFSSDEMRERSGAIDFSSEVAKAVDAAIPRDFATHKQPASKSHLLRHSKTLAT